MSDAHDDEDEEEYEFPTVLYEDPNPSQERGDEDRAEEEEGGCAAPPSSTIGTSARSFALLTVSDRPQSGGRKMSKSPVTTWEDVGALPYRMMEIDCADTAMEVEIVDAWNEGDDPAFRTCWETTRRKRDDR